MIHARPRLTRLRFNTALGLLAAGLLFESGVDLDRAVSAFASNSGQMACGYEHLRAQAVDAGTAQGWMMAGDCAVTLGDPATALEAYLYAHTIGGMTGDETLYVLRSIGFQAEAAGDLNRSRWAWVEAASLSQSASDRLRAARALRLAGEEGAARARLATLDETAFDGSERALFYEERARTIAADQPREAAMWMDRAIAIEPAAFRHFDKGLWLQAAGDHAGALIALEAAHAADPHNRDIALTNAYAYRRAGRHEEAALIFADVAGREQLNLSVREEEGYARAAAGQRSAAATAFRDAIDRHGEAGTGNDDPARLYRLRREVETLERTTYFTGYLTYRDDAVFSGFTLPEQGSFESQIGMEAGWRPEALYRAGRGLTLYGRAYQSLEAGSLSLADDTLQLGLGARWRPLANHDFSLAGERLIAGGDLARDAWLLRASYGWTQGGDWNPVADRWVYTSLYGDLAWIPDDPQFMSAYASVRHGLRFRAGEGWAVTPYLTAVGQISDDSFVTRERLEAGAGVMVSRWFGEDQYRAYRHRVDFELEYRAGTGDTPDHSVIGRVVVNF
ncbi:MAG: NfrA family protein [Glycocaulis sp.]